MKKSLKAGIILGTVLVGGVTAYALYQKFKEDKDNKYINEVIETLISLEEDYDVAMTKLAGIKEDSYSNEELRNTKLNLATEEVNRIVDEHNRIVNEVFCENGIDLPDAITPVLKGVEE